MNIVNEIIPRKINERPTIWKGLTLGELTRLGLTSFIISIFISCFSTLLWFESIAVALICGFLLSQVCVLISILVGSAILSNSKLGKPYGYSDQQFAIKLSKLGLKKIPCISRTGLWFHKDY